MTKAERIQYDITVEKIYKKPDPRKRNQIKDVILIICMLACIAWMIWNWIQGLADNASLKDYALFFLPIPVTFFFVNVYWANRANDEFSDMCAIAKVRMVHKETKKEEKAYYLIDATQKYGSGVKEIEREYEGDGIRGLYRREVKSSDRTSRVVAQYSSNSRDVRLVIESESFDQGVTQAIESYQDYWKYFTILHLHNPRLIKKKNGCLYYTCFLDWGASCEVCISRHHGVRLEKID